MIDPMRYALDAWNWIAQRWCRWRGHRVAVIGVLDARRVVTLCPVCRHIGERLRADVAWRY